MTELEIMQRAKIYIDKMANGIDPITDREAAETDVINNVRVSRCLFYVSDILRQVIENGGAVTKPKIRKEPFRLTDEQLAGFRYSETPISITEITKRFNELAEDDAHVQLKHSQLTAWLIETGALRTVTRPDGKTAKEPTPQGLELGISTEQRTGQYGTYTATVYNKAAQQFLADHLPAILAASEPQKKEPEAPGSFWTKEREDRLIDLFLKKTPFSEIAAALRQTEAEVVSRLRQLRFLD